MAVRAAGFVIFRRVSNRIEYLFLKASYGKEHWTPPKGHVDPGETDEITAYRETNEECGLLKTDIRVYENSKQVLEYNVDCKPKVVIYWLAELINLNAEITLSSEHQSYKWLDIESVSAFALHQNMIQLLNCYNEFIRNMSCCNQLYLFVIPNISKAWASPRVSFRRRSTLLKNAFNLTLTEIIEDRKSPSLSISLFNHYETVNRTGTPRGDPHYFVGSASHRGDQIRVIYNR